VVACGDDDTGNNGDGGLEGDGGVSPGAGSGGKGSSVSNFNEVNKALDDLNKDLQDGLDGVNGDIGDANDKIDDLSKQADDLADQLAHINDPANCSANQACIPDGLGITAMGLADVISKLCSLEIDCCDADELNYKFGPGITTVKECTDTFTDMVNNGLSPSFLSQNGVLINRVIAIAQAINSNDVQVEIDPKAVKACVDYLGKRECQKFEALDVEPATHCEVIDYTDTDDPCSLDLLVKGAQQEGQVCGVTGVNECDAGLVCRYVPSSDFGICATPSAIGDHCRADSDCDGTEQFCNLGTGTCQERGDEGDDCEHVDPTFNYEGLGPSIVSGWENPAAVKIECKRGLVCDPTSNKCVSNCSAGAFCQNNAGCPEGLICNTALNDGLRIHYNMGVCTDPIATGDPCFCNLGTPVVGGKCIDNATGLEQENSQCESGRCAMGDNGLECTEALKPVGASCTLGAPGVGQPDATCISRWCAGDGKCATQCTPYAPPNYFAEVPCADPNYYCNVAIGSIPYGGSPTTTGRFACEPKKANDSACHVQALSSDGALYYPGDTNFNYPENYECASGYCDGGTSQCKPRIAANTTCPFTASNARASCTGSWCKMVDAMPTYTCIAYVAPGGACDQSDARVCGPDAYCATVGTNMNKCVSYAAAGEACDNTNDVRCDTTDEAHYLNCALTSATAGVCAEYGMYPNGSTCNGNDEQCASQWCNGDNTCQEPVAEGEDCNVSAPEIRCAEGTYCNFDNLPQTDPDYGKGTCTAKGLAGQSCDPRFNSSDCVDECVLRNDSFVCDSYSLPDETLFCDGE
jgi:hypothetical protein